MKLVNLCKCKVEINFNNLKFEKDHFANTTVRAVKSILLTVTTLGYIISDQLFQNINFNISRNDYSW